MKLFNFIILISLFIFLVPIHAHADDTDLFTVKVPPDALLVLDLSGSMNWTPAGSTMYIADTQTCGDDVEYYPTSETGHTNVCSIDTSSVPKYSNAECSGPFYKTSRTDYFTDCSRLEIAKRAIFDLLDDSDDNKINRDDQDSLGIRIGYMKLYNCSSDDTGGDYLGGCITLIKPITVSNSEDPTPYDGVWSAVSNEKCEGGTPLASALNEAKIYLDDTKIGNKAKDIKVDSAAECRKKFVLFITDGSDTFSCLGNGWEEQIDQYKRRRETVAKAKALADAGYKVFAVGFGATMPHHLKNTLNWVTYFGGTDNPSVDNSGDIKGYNPINVSSCQNDYPNCPPTCKSYFDSNCQQDCPPTHNLNDGTHAYAQNNDPGEKDLSGYAFLATSASQLTATLKTIMTSIQEHSFSFTAPTIPSVRLIDKDFVYISSFIPNNTPFWRGNLKAYKLNEDGTLPVDKDGNPFDSNLIWDASEKLKGTKPDARIIYTVKNNVRTSFEYENLTNDDLVVTSDSDRIDLINHIRGTDAYDINNNKNKTEEREWKLGDIFHSNAVIVGSPSSFFEDVGFSGPGGFYEKNKDRKKVIIVGANDGMLHAFDASSGDEKWAFIPNSLLKNLKLMKSAHTYYCDATPKVADVWFGDNSNKKTTDEWRTVLVSGLRKGGKHYFALDITDTSQPNYLWEFPSPKDPNISNYQDFFDKKLGQSWSEPAIGKIKIEQGGELVEKWVAFIGGGFDLGEKIDKDATIGKAFFVIDMKRGEIIKEFSGLESMNYAFVASPTAVDTNFDGYVDRVYIGDLGGQMWVFDVSFDEINNKSNSKWTGEILFKAPKASAEKHNIYYQPAVAFDRYRNSWVYFGTGDRESPKDTKNPQERFYAVRDNRIKKYPLDEQDLSNVTHSNTFKQDQKTNGWYIKLEKTGKRLEKVLAKPTVFNKLLYFTTYTYDDKGDPCSVAGDAKLYIVEYLSGGGALAVDELADLSGTPSERLKIIGSGVPSAPVITVNIQGKDSVIVGTTSGQAHSDKVFSPTTTKEILYWREVIP